MVWSLKTGIDFRGQVQKQVRFPRPNLITGIDFKGWIWKWLLKTFGLKDGQGLQDQAAKPHCTNFAGRNFFYTYAAQSSIQSLNRFTISLLLLHCRSTLNMRLLMPPIEQLHNKLHPMACRALDELLCNEFSN